MVKSFSEFMITEKVKDIKARNLPNVPGIKYIVHYISDEHKYLSLVHAVSGKYLIKSFPIDFVLKSVDLASHLFSRYDFTKPHEDIAQESKLLHPVIAQFEAEIEKLRPVIDPKKVVAKANKSKAKASVNKKKV